MFIYNDVEKGVFLDTPTAKLVLYKLTTDSYSQSDTDQKCRGLPRLNPQLRRRQDNMFGTPTSAGSLKAHEQFLRPSLNATFCSCSYSLTFLFRTNTNIFVLKVRVT